MPVIVISQRIAVFEQRTLLIEAGNLPAVIQLKDRVRSEEILIETIGTFLPV
jgi:hypothetical protein